MPGTGFKSLRDKGFASIWGIFCSPCKISLRCQLRRNRGNPEKQVRLIVRLIDYARFSHAFGFAVTSGSVDVVGQRALNVVSGGFR